MVHTGAEVKTFPPRALLENVAPQDHIDDSDAAYRVARVVIFGDFEDETIRSSGGKCQRGTQVGILLCRNLE